VAGGPVNRIDQVFAMEQIQARGMDVTMDHPLSAEPVRLVGSPLKLSENAPSYRHAPPVCGEHTNEILQKILSLPERELEDLRARRVIS